MTSSEPEHRLPTYLEAVGENARYETVFLNDTATTRLVVTNLRQQADDDPPPSYESLFGNDERRARDNSSLRAALRGENSISISVSSSTASTTSSSTEVAARALAADRARTASERLRRTLSLERMDKEFQWTAITVGVCVSLLVILVLVITAVVTGRGGGGDD
ncbi:m42 protein [Murid betaherpesvirus 1]|uniref:M42 n=3 Tax=Murid herpesvirus 1 TaxID=10366 RepID=B3UWZ7_MUHV1|nr:m42 [Muromegalovirus G4]ACE95391.1 m42 [Muromegalovirus WP15B]QNL29191.1 m42 [Muromegalovirus G4]CCE56552.1 m42 protein [Murid betaherpesvirus 1]CCE57376.1 m42 protein [Murid betaherpesvirus 1]